MDSTSYKGDILFSFIGKKNPKSPQFGDFEPLNVQPRDVKIFDHCLNQPLLISKDILNKCNKHTACSNVKAIGYQHINRHKIIETDASDSSINDMFSLTSEDILDVDEWQEPEKKRRKINNFKTCQLKIFMDCNNLLLLHDDNFTQLQVPR